MKNTRNHRRYILYSMLTLFVIIAISAALACHAMQRSIMYTKPYSGIQALEEIKDDAVPLAAAKPTAEETSELSSDPIATPTEPTPTPTPAAVPVIVHVAATQQTNPPAPAITPAPSEETIPANEAETPAEEETTPAPEPAEATPTTDPAEDAPALASAKAQKPEDITDTTAMAKYLFDAATEFWAVEKDFSGTTTRPVSTRVAASIGAGTAVDCPGGDTVRIDKNGDAHDSYAIADHFREYVEMPDLQNFKIYLSEKDYTADPYGAREDVIGSYYQYGPERATYMAEEDEAEE